MNTSPFVMVGCDGSPESDPALRFAAEEARLRGVRLVVVTAYERSVDPDLDAIDTPDSALRAKARGKAETALRRALGLPSDELGCDVICEEGEPARLLTDQSSGAIMIVVGSHDRSLLGRLFDRNTGRELLQASDVPVTVVPSAST